MSKYLGEEIIPINQTPFKNYTKLEWVEYFINNYMYIDGNHHKQWLLNECLKIIKGTEVIIKLAKWDSDFTEWRISTGKLSNEYLDYLKLNQFEIEDVCGIAP